jgi:hypothetical protein
MERLLLQRFELPLAAAYEVLRDDFEAASRYWSAHALATVTDPTFETFNG